MNNKKIRLEMKIELIFASFLFFVFLFSSGVFAVQKIASLSNESLKAKAEVGNASLCFKEMQERNVSIKRTNDSLSDAKQLYDAQIALEEKGKKADYNLVLKYATEVCAIKEKAFKAADELKIFKESFEEARQRINASSMEEDYKNILISFEEERFEDSLKFIEEGYKSLSELEASQTTLKLFYTTTTRTVKDFFIENWKKLSIISGIILFLLLIFWKALQKIRIRLKLRNLRLQKGALNELIKNLQDIYFEKKTVGESEYRIKLEKFKEMIRDLDRQIPLLNEKMSRLEKKGLTPDETETPIQEEKKDENVHSDKNVKKRRKRKKN